MKIVRTSAWTLFQIVVMYSMIGFGLISLDACKGSDSTGRGGGGYERTGDKTGVNSSASMDSAGGTAVERRGGDMESAGANAKAGHAVKVQLTEFKIIMPSTLKPGPVTFHIANTGKKTHNFRIEGNGIEKKLDDDLESGQTAELQVDLKPGTYKVSCPIFGHVTMGMSTEITVEER